MAFAVAKRAAIIAQDLRSSNRFSRILQHFPVLRSGKNRGAEKNYNNHMTAASFVVLPCNCEVDTTLPLRSLPDITQHRNPSSRDTDFANFVCPHCGLGSLHLVGQLQRCEATSVARIVRPPLYCASLQCGSEHCELHVQAHTIAQSGAQNAEPIRAVRKWKVDSLECRVGHHANHPAECKEHYVFNPEPE
jgi:hypothetical protein